MYTVVTCVTCNLMSWIGLLRLVQVSRVCSMGDVGSLPTPTVSAHE